MQDNENAPHKTVVWLKAITYEVLPTGECSGKPVQSREEILQIDGINKLTCIEKTCKFMEEIKNVNKSARTEL